MPISDNTYTKDDSSDEDTLVYELDLAGARELLSCLLPIKDSTTNAIAAFYTLLEDSISAVESDGGELTIGLTIFKEEGTEGAKDAGV